MPTRQNRKTVTHARIVKTTAGRSAVAGIGALTWLTS